MNLLCYLPSCLVTRRVLFVESVFVSDQIHICFSFFFFLFFCSDLYAYSDSYVIFWLLDFYNLNVVLNECRCNEEDILLEMDRILRPEGAVIFRDEVDVLIKMKKIVGGMRWDTKMVDHEDGPLVPEKILIAVKQYWVAGGNSTSAQ